MKKHFSWAKTCILTTILCCPIALMAQNNSAEPQNRLLDSATYRVIYLTTQRAEREHKPIVIADSMTLEWGNNWSCYYDLNKKFRDSMQTAHDMTVMSSITSMTVSMDQNELEQRLRNNRDNAQIKDTEHDGESYRIYRNRTDGQTITIDNGPYAGSSVKSFIQVNENIRHSWKVSTDTASVLGYNCIKAVATFHGRTYTVWFTPDIPIPEGPWKLFGLPGLILKAEDKDGLFTFEAIGMENLREPQPIEIKWESRRKVSVTKGTLEQWYGLRNKSRANINVMYHNGNGAYTAYSMPNPITYINMEVMK